VQSLLFILSAPADHFTNYKRKKKPVRRFTILLALLAMFPVTALAQPQPANLQPRSQCFEQTGFCVSDPLLKYWEKNGGLPVFGYPITEARTEAVEDWTGTVQWFERDRLEDHGPQGVMAGRLGAAILEIQGNPWFGFPRVEGAPAGCRYYPQTHHSLCQPFLAYWDSNGGLERFGYPITEPFTTAVGDWNGSVQYFERRRMEHHTENLGTKYEVLLGLLGREVLSAASCQNAVMADLRGAYDSIENFRGAMGCPGAVFMDRPAAVQNFENGLMIWVDLDGSDRRIYALIGSYRYLQYNDPWKEGDPEVPAVTPPEHLYAPRRGFGKAWIDDPELRSSIGWAVEERERADRANVQLFDRGAMVWLVSANKVYVFGPDSYNLQIISR
jgi:hypothetical protein